ncbi:hypothetical protein LCGC14_1599450, partial [marine sediment metagenome]
MARQKDPKEQKRLEGMPERSVLGKKAIEYLDARDTVELAKKKSDAVKNELVDLFIKEGQTSIIVDGQTVFYSHMERDQIK